MRATRSRVSASCSANVSAKLRLFQLSAYFAAIRIITGRSAAMTIGGLGDCTGRGFITASLTL